MESLGKSHTFASITSNFQNHFAWYNLVISEIKREGDFWENCDTLKLGWVFGIMKEVNLGFNAYFYFQFALIENKKPEGVVV